MSGRRVLAHDEVIEKNSDVMPRPKQPLSIQYTHLTYWTGDIIMGEIGIVSTDNFIRDSIKFEIAKKGQFIACAHYHVHKIQRTSYSGKYELFCFFQLTRTASQVNPCESKETKESKSESTYTHNESVELFIVDVQTRKVFKKELLFQYSDPVKYDKETSDQISKSYKFEKSSSFFIQPFLNPNTNKFAILSSRENQSFICEINSDGVFKRPFNIGLDYSASFLESSDEQYLAVHCSTNTSLFKQNSDCYQLIGSRDQAMPSDFESRPYIFALNSLIFTEKSTLFQMNFKGNCQKLDALSCKPSKLEFISDGDIEIEDHQSKYNDDFETQWIGVYNYTLLSIHKYMTAYILKLIANAMPTCSLDVCNIAAGYTARFTLFTPQRTPFEFTSFHSKEFENEQKEFLSLFNAGNSIEKRALKKLLQLMDEGDTVHDAAKECFDDYTKVLDLTNKALQFFKKQFTYDCANQYWVFQF